jgi:hypothetical protein
LTWREAGDVAYPPLVQYATEQEYRAHFEQVYCCGVLQCFDGIAVRFNKSDFDHCFFESSRRDGVKDQFSPLRAERIDWIKAALQDGQADLFVGWDSKKRRYDHGRRVTLVMGNYVVVIRLMGSLKARFVTAFVADSDRTLKRIKESPRWTQHSA